MDTRQLEVYIKAALYLNFTEASKHLNMVPSAVSHSISMLENELDEKLFYRANNKLSLTEFGEVFLEEAIKINNIANNAISKNINASGLSKTLNVGCVFPEFIIKFEPAFLKFYEDKPEVSLTYNRYDSITLLKKLSDMEIDVAFGRESTFQSHSNIEWTSLYKDPFKLLMHKEHPLAGKKKITVPMIKNETIITMSRNSNPGMFDMVTHLFNSHNITPLLNDQNNHHLTTILLAGMKKGVVVIPWLNICYAKLPKDILIKEIDDPLAFHEIGIAKNSKSSKNLIDSFIQNIIEFNKTISE